MLEFSESQLLDILELAGGRTRALSMDLQNMSASVPDSDWEEVSAAWSKSWLAINSIIDTAKAQLEARRAAIEAMKTGPASFSTPVPLRPVDVEVPTVGEDGLYCILVGGYVVSYEEGQLPWKVRHGASDGELVGEYSRKSTALDRAHTLNDKVK